mgnify:CR=1 FL=1
MQKLLLAITFLSVISFVSSCKTGAANIDINDVEMHRAYQDTLIYKSKTSVEVIQCVKRLISEYKRLSNYDLENNSNYNYYLSRLYGKIFDISYFGGIYDTINKKYIVFDENTKKPWFQGNHVCKMLKYIKPFFQNLFNIF